MIQSTEDWHMRGRYARVHCPRCGVFKDEPTDDVASDGSLVLDCLHCHQSTTVELLGWPPPEAA